MHWRPRGYSPKKYQILMIIPTTKLHHIQDKQATNLIQKLDLERIEQKRKEIKRFITSLNNQVNNISSLLSKAELNKRSKLTPQPTDLANLFDLGLNSSKEKKKKQCIYKLQATETTVGSSITTTRLSSIPITSYHGSQQNPRAPL